MPIFSNVLSGIKEGGDEDLEYVEYNTALAVVIGNSHSLTTLRRLWEHNCKSTSLVQKLTNWSCDRSAPLFSNVFIRT